MKIGKITVWQGYDGVNHACIEECGTVLDEYAKFMYSTGFCYNADLVWDVFDFEAIKTDSFLDIIGKLNAAFEKYAYPCSRNEAAVYQYAKNYEHLERHIIGLLGTVKPHKHSDWYIDIMTRVEKINKVTDDDYYCECDISSYVEKHYDIDCLINDVSNIYDMNKLLISPLEMIGHNPTLRKCAEDYLDELERKNGIC